MSKLNGKELAVAFGDSVNNYNFNQEEFVNTFARQHRTLQQSMIRAMLGCIEKCAEPDYGRDGRNEMSHQTCKDMVNGWRKELKTKLLSSGNHYWTEEKANGYIGNPEVKPSNLPTI